MMKILHLHQLNNVKPLQLSQQHQSDNSQGLLEQQQEQERRDLERQDQIQLEQQENVEDQDSTKISKVAPQSSQDPQQAGESGVFTDTEALKSTLKIEDRSNRKPNAPIQYTDSAFGFPLPPASHSTLVMLDYRYPIQVERAIYRLSHLKLADAKRPLYQQVLLSNFMYAYLNLVNHTLYLQQMTLDGQQSDNEDQVLQNGFDDSKQEELVDSDANSQKLANGNGGSFVEEYAAGDEQKNSENNEIYQGEELYYN
ncbi:unnamed protein product [[Candida] boidinii]|uniref:Unnamed protein product n=1 Tax=Candida boidinii TaxID=5477 RepID=A0ACB5U521_CANBO|nr:unnamed protein product [[Candida] boidinii]